MWVFSACYILGFLLSFAACTLIQSTLMSTTTKSAKPDLLHGEIEPTLKSMTIPVILGMIALMSFNLVDTFFIGLMGTEQLAAISFTFPITFTVISLMIGLGIGTSAVVAKSVGRKKISTAKAQATCAVVLSTLLVLALCLVGLVTIDPIFSLLGADGQTLVYINDYMSIWYFGALFLTLPMIGNSVLRANGDTKVPSQVMAAGGLVNAILDPILIFGFGPIPAMGMEGAALATLLSWIIGSAIIVYIIIVRRRLVSSTLPNWRLTKLSAQGMLKIGLPAAGANMLTPIAAAILTGIIASYGDEAVAAFGVGTRLESIACIVVLALSMSFPPFVSQNFGAKQIERIALSYRKLIKFVLIWQFGIYVVMGLLAFPISWVFSKEADVQALIKLFLWIMPLAYGAQGIVILTNSSLNALHKPMAALNLSVVRLFILYVPLSYIGGLLGGVTGLFIGGVIANLAMAIISYRYLSGLLNQCGLKSAGKS